MSSSPIIRLLGPTDVPVLNRVAPDVFDHAIDARWASEFLADGRHHLVVALLEEEVVGMVSAVHYVHPDKPPELWVSEVGVTPSLQGRGIAKQLMAVMLAHGRSLGCRKAWVLTDEANVVARRLYAAVGGAEKPAVMVSFRLADEP